MSISRRSMLLTGTSLLIAGLSAQAQEHDHSHHQHDSAGASGGADEHAAHRQMLARPEFTQSLRDYAVPRVTLQDDAGRDVALTTALAPDVPLIVNFIYTSCTTICPVMTASFLQLQKALAGSRTMPRFVSISVDPDFDSPEILKAYAARHGAHWTFLTGKRATVLEVLRHFDVWRGGKANHLAVALLRKSGGTPWTRVEGLASAGQLADIWNGLRG